MADYWKSQPRKFCQYCKCWIADNKPSIEFHERGKNHKENVAAKISEIKKKSVDKAKQEKKMCKQFAAMEEAAMKAYEEDLKRMERESQGFSSPAPAPASVPAYSPAPSPVQPPPRANPQPKKQKRKQEKPRMKPRQQTESQVWVEGVSDEGHTYYYNATTGESRWEKPEDFRGSAQYEETAVPQSSSGSAQYEETAVPQSSSGSAWMEAVSPDGFTYYYKAETGESSWEKPADFISSEASGEEPVAPEAPSGGEPSSDPAPETQEDPDQSSQQSNIPKISFRKRKADSEPSGEEEDEKDDDDDDDLAGADTTKEDGKETKEVEKVVQSTTVEPEKTEEKKTEVKIRIRRPRTVNPYGAWEKIKEEMDPYANVDLQLPRVEESMSSAPADPPPEPKPKFKERIITSLGDEGGPASFRKNKTQNGKSRRLRQRDDDD